MGYTHYLRFNKSVTKERLSKASEDIKKAFELIKAEYPNITIKDGWGENEPKIDENTICFNGDASKEEDFETFAVRVGDKGFNCWSVTGVSLINERDLPVAVSSLRMTHSSA